MKQEEAVNARDADDRFTGLKLSELNEQEKRSIVTLATQVLAVKFRAGRALSNPEATRTYLRLKLADYRNEVFGSLFLDNRHRIIATRELFQGTIDGASVHPRVVVQTGTGGERCRPGALPQPPLGGGRTQPGGRVAHPAVERRTGTGRCARARSLRGLRRRERVLRRMWTYIICGVTACGPSSRASLPL